MESKRTTEQEGGTDKQDEPLGDNASKRTPSPAAIAALLSRTSMITSWGSMAFAVSVWPAPATNRIPEEGLGPEES